MVRVLTDSETAAFLERHPEITADMIPSAGYLVYENGRDYLVGIVHDTGEIKVIDRTTIVDDKRIDPSVANWGEFDLLWYAIKDTSKDIFNDVAKIFSPEGLIVAAGIVVGYLWLTRK